MSSDDTQKFAESLMTVSQNETLLAEKNLDFAFEFSGTRFR
jgi:Tfp pilus assembly pilus retraction ATPase PilT